MFYNARTVHTQHKPFFKSEVIFNSGTNNHAIKVITPNPI